MTYKKRLYKAFLPVLFAMIVCAAPSVSMAQDVESLDREDIVALSRPSVVRVVRKVAGTATVPGWRIDMRSRTIEIDETRPKQTIQIDETLSGSGFVVSSDGYIATNAHVVSLTPIIIDAMSDSVIEALYAGSSKLSDEELDAFLNDKEFLKSFYHDIFDYVSAHGWLDVSDEVMILQPISEATDLEKAFEDGIPAEIAYVNDRFYLDDKDIAFLHIDQSRVPSLPLGDFSSVFVGKQVSLFGFPASADFNGRDIVEPTFAQGIVNAVRTSSSEDFSIFQVDAKVSEGSSGGPLLDGSGEVIGMISFQAGGVAGFYGDNFAFAIPSNVIAEAMSHIDIDANAIGYRELMRSGLSLMRDHRCEEALHVFDIAKNSGNELFLSSQLMQAYERRCEIMIAEQKSLDSFWERSWAFAKSLGMATKVAILSSAAFGLALFFTVWRLILEVKREEREIRILEEKLRNDEGKISENTSTLERVLQDHLRE